MIEKTMRETLKEIIKILFLKSFSIETGTLQTKLSPKLEN